MYYVFTFLVSGNNFHSYVVSGIDFFGVCVEYFGIFT